MSCISTNAATACIAVSLYRKTVFTQFAAYLQKKATECLLGVKDLCATVERRLNDET